MEESTIITRADDFGSVHAANQAILQAVTKGSLIKNVSCMAIGSAIEDGARLLKDVENIDIGLHLTLLSEWDGIKWQPAAPKEQISTLLNENGEFYQSPQQLAAAKPDLDEILLEYDAQLARLTMLGLKADYVDSHMAPELLVPGLEQALAEWVSSKGLVDAGKYYHFAEPPMPVWGDSQQEYFENIEVWLNGLKEDRQYTYVLHPSVKSEETRLFSNEHFPPGIVEKERALEYQSAISGQWRDWLEGRNIQVLRYSEAIAKGSNDALRKLFNF
jgi:predicted glycoside hydrolase/deacetylase ChbG (UPF0249 family)